MRGSMRGLTSSEARPESRRAAVGMKKVKVELLDGSQIDVDVERKAKGAELLDKVCEQLDVTEKDFFGLLHTERGDPRVWVDLERRLSKTFKNEPWDVRFAVKFYPPEPSELQEDITRDHLQLAIKRDLIEGRLSCSFVTHALLASYLLQAELGDMEDDQVDSAVLLQHHVVPTSVLCDEMHKKIETLYGRHRGQNPAEAILNYLENAKKLSLYGAELHCARDSEEVDIVLGVCSHGVTVYRDGVLMNRFPWAKILKIGYNKRTYTLKLRAGGFDEFETSLVFKLPSTGASKKLWRCSVEHHIFFRRAEPVVVKRIPRFSAFGSRRLSCRRTLRQMRAEPQHHQPEITAM